MIFASGVGREGTRVGACACQDIFLKAFSQVTVGRSHAGPAGLSSTRFQTSGIASDVGDFS